MPRGGNYLVSTGRFALRGISRAQDLYTLDPDITADEVVAREVRALSGGLGRESHKFSVIGHAALVRIPDS